MASAASNAFRQLNDADLRFGEIEDHTGVKIELSHATIHGHDVRYRRAGTGDTIVLLHGLAGSSRTWRPPTACTVGAWSGSWPATTRRPGTCTRRPASTGPSARARPT